MIRHNTLILIVFLTWTACTSPKTDDKQTILSDTIPKKDSLLVSSVAMQMNDTPSLNGTTGDTIFIIREVTKDYYHAIYIEKNRHSKFYIRLSNFSFDEYDKESFEMNYNEIKEEHGYKLKKFSRSGLPSEWVPLYIYKGDYYLYAPSDWGNAGKRIITDSTLVYWYMDGPYPMPLTSFKKVTGNKYSLTSFTPQNMDNGSNQLIIHIIDRKNKIAVWEFPAEDEEYRYQLYVPKENIESFDMVVNYCRDMKQMEFDFDKIDYEKLLNAR